MFYGNQIAINVSKFLKIVAFVEKSSFQEFTKCMHIIYKTIFYLKFIFLVIFINI